jgi:hypothetical protein
MFATHVKSLSVCAISVVAAGCGGESRGVARATNERPANHAVWKRLRTASFDEQHGYHDAHDSDDRHERRCAVLHRERFRDHPPPDAGE